MKIAHASDLHCSERHRLDDWIALHDTMVDQMEAAGVELILLTGDLFHAKSSPAERNAMVGFLQGAAELAPVVVVKGNHDAAGDLDIFRALRAPHPIHVLSVAGPLHLPGVTVIGLPWFDKATIAASLPPDAGGQDSTNAAIDAARHLLDVLRGETSLARSAGQIPILAGHVQIGGAETSTGQTLIGTTVELSPADIKDVGCEYAALGHIHKAQSWYGGQVAYAGSTWRQNFAEPEAKGWWLVSIGAGKFSGSSFVELPARRITLIECAAHEAPMAIAAADIQRGDLVRLRYSATPEALAALDADSLSAALEARGAAAVKLEAVVVQQARVRCEQIIEARDTFAKVTAWLDAKGIQVDAATRERLRERLAAIEARAADEVPA